MSRKTILLGVLLLLSVAMAGYFFIVRAPGRSVGLPGTRHDYIAVSARIDPGMSRREVIALVGKPESNMVLSDADFDRAKVAPAKRGSLPYSYTSWYIGREGEGDFWSRIFPPYHPQRQYLNVDFDRNDRVLSTSIETDKNFLYED